MLIPARSSLRLFALSSFSLAGVPALVVACSSGSATTTATGTGGSGASSSHASTGTGTGGVAATGTGGVATTGTGGSATTGTGGASITGGVGGGAITGGTGGGDAGMTCREACRAAHPGEFKKLELYELAECACTDAGAPPCSSQCTAECAMPVKLTAGSPCGTCIAGQATDACIATARNTDCAQDAMCDPYLTCVSACPGG